MLKIQNFNIKIVMLDEKKKSNFAVKRWNKENAVY